MERAAIYIRVSTDEQAASAEAQEAGARAWCERKGFVVVAVHRDVGVSGAEWKNRPGILALEIEARRAPRPWDVVVAMFQDRLGRDPERVGMLLVTLRDCGVRVFEWAPDKEVPLDSMGRLYASIRSHMAAHEREMGSARTFAALEHKARKGLVVGGSVFGYGRERTPEGVRYTIHEGQAAIVRDIFRRAIEGDSARTIAHVLNLQGHPSPRADGGGTGSWSTSEVRGILRSDRYKGIVRWGRKGSKYTDGTRVETERDEAQRVEVHMPDLAIVDAETWQRAQCNTVRARAESGMVAQRSRVPRYLLVGNATCGACGGPLGSGRTSRNKVIIPSYCCLWHRDRGGTICPEGYSRATDVLDEIVGDWMENDLLDEELAAGSIDDALEGDDADERDARRLVDLQAEERDLSVRVKRLAQAVAFGAGDVPELAALMSDTSRALAVVRGELSSLAAPRRAMPVQVAGLDRIREARRAIRRVRTERPDLLRPLLAACLVGRIRVIPSGPRGPLRLEGMGAPGALLSALVDGEQGARGAVATPPGSASTPWRVIALQRAA